MASSRRKKIEVRAIRTEQNSDHPLYLFHLKAKDLLAVAEISRVSRGLEGKWLGYQRPEVKRHVNEIAEYLNNDDALFVHPLVFALASSVTFRKSRGPRVKAGGTAGVLEIPIQVGKQRKPAWIVDGQQRALAIAKCNRSDLEVPISAFVCDDIELQRDQFMRVNNTKPLPRGLISELLPEVSTDLPPKLAARRMPAALCDLLNRLPESPFHGRIRRSSTPPSERKKCVFADTSVIKMLQASLTNPTGGLFSYRNMATGETDFDGIMKLLCIYWTAVAKTFPAAWDQPATKSRLTHGAGVIAMGRLMDRVMTVVSSSSPDAVQQAARELRRVRPVCSWTSGHWNDLDGRAWNDIENTPRDIRLLSNLLVRIYIERRR